MLIFDAHLDMAWNAVNWNRDLMAPIADRRAYEAETDMTYLGESTVSWPELQRGKIGIVIATLLPRVPMQHHRNAQLSFYHSREAAYAACYGQLSYYHAMEQRDIISSIGDRAELDEHLANWEEDDSGKHPIGYILSMEGSWGVLNPDMIEEWYYAGLRILGPAHYGEDYYCHGTGSKGGLKEEGPALLKKMDEVGMLLDVTHLADQSFWEALDIFEGRVLASHHNSRTLVPGDRQLDDKQIQTLVERGAVIGASFDCWMVKKDWKIGVSDPKTASIEDVANHTDYICQLVGSAKHCGIGSDLDGGFGKASTPHDLDTIADLQKFAEILDRKGYSQNDIEGIMYKNFVNFFRDAWGEE